LNLSRKNWLEAKEQYVTRSFINCTLRAEGKEDKIGEACRTHGRDEKCVQNSDQEA